MLLKLKYVAMLRLSAGIVDSRLVV